MTNPARPLPPLDATAPTLPATESRTAWPWYRREPWLAVELLAFVPLLAALAVPRRFQLALIAVGGLLVALGLVLLWRQGPFAARRPTDGR
jgi:hypothetical protein